ncbi:MAG: hypothetical protein EOO38_18440 [Cytophagaceae bacterium]|nr:MAG: hypothetical protein EOO38_18440 [Cytophagaceae bacterium]
MCFSEQVAFPFPTVLEIRSQFALANVHKRCDLGKHFELLGWALNEAQLAAYHIANAKDADVPCPTLFCDEPMLVDAWNRGIQTAADKRYHWHMRDSLPDVETLYGLLLRGQRCEVNGHSLSPDEHGVWITNPYGNDCGLWQNMTFERVGEFLTDMAVGKEYGPTPY